MVRQGLGRLLNQFLETGNTEKSPAAMRIDSQLSWLTTIYTGRTGIRDFSRRFSLYRRWDNQNFLEKRRLDSCLRQIISEVRDESAPVDSLLSLAGNYREIGDSVSLAESYYQIAGMFHKKQLVDSALKYYEIAYQIAGQNDFYDIMGTIELARSKIFQIYNADYFQAEKSVQAGLRCFRITDSKYSIATALIYQGYLYQQLYQTRKAIQCFSRSIPFYRSLKSDKGLGDGLYYLAESYYDEGFLDSAMHYAGQSLEIRDRLNRKYGNLASDVGYAISCQALIDQALDNTQAAEAGYQAADSILNSANDTVGITLNRVRLANYFLENRAYVRAENLFREILRLSPRHEELMASMYGLALCRYYGSRDDSSALRILEIAAKNLDKTSRNFPVPELKTGFLSDKLGIYSLLVKILLERYRQSGSAVMLDSAYMYHERGRAGTIPEILSTRVVTKGVNKESSLLDSLSRLYTASILGRGSDSLMAAIWQTEESLLFLRVSAIENRGHDENSQTPYSADLHMLRKGLSRDELILDYSVSPFGVEAFCISGDSVSVHSLSMDYDSLKALVHKYCQRLTTYPGENDFSPLEKGLSRQLYAALIPDSIAKSGISSKLIIMTSDFLERLPFETLIDKDGDFLIQNYNVSYGLSATLLQLLKNRHDGDNMHGQGMVAALGDPVIMAGEANPENMYDKSGDPSDNMYTGWNIEKLQYAGKELDAIKSVFGASRVYLLREETFTETAFKNLDFNKFRYIHLATHGLVDYYIPERSAIVFSAGGNCDSVNDGIMQASEISGLYMPGNIVFLSACNTASGRAYLGEGTMSLARPFIIAGCRAVIAAKWNVDDLSSYKLVKDFYGNINSGNSPAEALSAAKRNLINSEYAHPYFWSPFIFIGSNIDN